MSRLNLHPTYIMLVDFPMHFLIGYRQFMPDNMKQDLVVVNQATKDAVNVDVMCPYESGPIGFVRQEPKRYRSTQDFSTERRRTPTIQYPFTLWLWEPLAEIRRTRPSCRPSASALVTLNSFPYYVVSMQEVSGHVETTTPVEVLSASSVHHLSQRVFTSN